VEFYLFNAEYVQRLAEGDPATEAHFSAYFGKFIFLKLRSRRVSPEMAEDVSQETLLRVLKALRFGSGVAQPDRFGAFVNSVCNNVLLELSHKQAKHPAIDEDAPEPSDVRVNLDATLISEQRKRIVASVLDELSEKDREILRLIFFEEADRKEISERLNVEPDYLRVLLHRAKSKFEAAYLRKHGPLSHAISLICSYGILLGLALPPACS
jgi:RNA polymerase sigma-70 factor (ECF subfamily)